MPAPRQRTEDFLKTKEQTVLPGEKKTKHHDCFTFLFLELWENVFIKKAQSLKSSVCTFTTPPLAEKKSKDESVTVSSCVPIFHCFHWMTHHCY